MDTYVLITIAQMNSFIVSRTGGSRRRRRLGIRYLLCFGLILLAKFPTQRPCQLHFTPKLGVKWYNLTACRVRHGVRPDLICQPGHSPGIKTHSSPAAFPTTLSLSFSDTKIIAVSCLSSD